MTTEHDSVDRLVNRTVVGTLRSIRTRTDGMTGDEVHDYLTSLLRELDPAKELVLA